MRRKAYLRPEACLMGMRLERFITASPPKTSVDDYAGNGQGGTGLGEDVGEGQDDDDPAAKIFIGVDLWGDDF